MGNDIFGMPRGIPCCCLSGCCPDTVLPDCLTLELMSSCCEDPSTIVLTRDTVSPACPGGEKRPGTPSESFCGYVPDILYTGALDAAWCVGNELSNATVLVFCCVDPITNEPTWWIYIGDSDLSHSWYPVTTPRYYPLILVSCNPLLLQLNGDPPDCSSENCVWTWKANCFVEGTLIRTPYGEVPIEDLEVGDVILDIHNQEVFVVETIPSEVDHLIRITDERGVYTGVTPEHPFMDEDMLNTIEARELEVGKKLPLGKEVTDIKLFKAKDQKFKVHNLRVTGSNTFIADGFAVHNKGQS